MHIKTYESCLSLPALARIVAYAYIGAAMKMATDPARTIFARP